jgi:hypothetical protein
MDTSLSKAEKIYQQLGRIYGTDEFNDILNGMVADGIAAVVADLAPEKFRRATEVMIDLWFPEIMSQVTVSAIFRNLGMTGHIVE